MKFQWNEAKRLEVLKERDLDILHAALIFEGPTLTKPDDREDYG